MAHHDSNPMESEVPVTAIVLPVVFVALIFFAAIIIRVCCKRSKKKSMTTYLQRHYFAPDNLSYSIFSKNSPTESYPQMGQVNKSFEAGEYVEYVPRGSDAQLTAQKTVRPKKYITVKKGEKPKRFKRKVKKVVRVKQLDTVDSSVNATSNKQETNTHSQNGNQTVHGLTEHSPMINNSSVAKYGVIDDTVRTNDVTGDVAITYAMAQDKSAKSNSKDGWSSSDELSNMRTTPNAALSPNTNSDNNSSSATPTRLMVQNMVKQYQNEQISRSPDQSPQKVRGNSPNYHGEQLLSPPKRFLQGAPIDAENLAQPKVQYTLADDLDQTDGGKYTMAEEVTGSKDPDVDDSDYDYAEDCVSPAGVSAQGGKESNVYESVKGGKVAKRRKKISKV